MFQQWPENTNSCLYKGGIEESSRVRELRERVVQIYTPFLFRVEFFNLHVGTRRATAYPVHTHKHILQTCSMYTLLQ